MPTSNSAAGSTRHRGSVPALRLGVFLVCALLGSVIVQSQIDDLELVEVTPYFCLAITLQLLPFFARDRADPFEPASLFGAFNLLAIVPAFLSFVVQSGISISLLPYVTGRARIELVQTVLVAYSAGSLAYYVGYYVRFGKRITRIFPDVAGSEWRRSRLSLVAAGCAAIFIPAYAYFQARLGGVALTDVTQLAAGKAVWREDATMSWLMRATGLGFIPLLLYVALHFQGLHVPRWIPGVPILTHLVHVVRHVPLFFTTVKGRRALLVFFVFFVVGLLTTRLGQRGTVLYVGLNALIIMHYVWRRVPMSLIFGLAFGAMVFSNVLGAYRSNREQATATMPGPAANFNAAETLVEHEGDRLRFTAMAVVFHHFPDRKDYLMGESWAAVAAVLIPRWLWPEKGQAFVWRDTNILPQLVGAPVPITYLALLYANFSWIGIALGMGFFGVFQRGLYEWMLRSQKDKSVAVLYSLTVLYLVPTMIQLSAAVGYLLPAWVAILFIRKKVGAKSTSKQRPAPALPGPARPLPALPEPGPAAAE